MPGIVGLPVAHQSVEQRGSTFALALALMALALSSLACSSGAPSPPKAAMTVSSAPAGTPAGWKTVVYGGLQVSVPDSWSVEAPIVNEILCRRPQHSVTPMSYTVQVSSSCPSESPDRPPPSNVSIGCDYGAASNPSLFPKPTATTIIEGRVLRWSQPDRGSYDVTMKSGSGLAEVQIGAEPPLAGLIFRSVRPSTRHC